MKKKPTIPVTLKNSKVLNQFSEGVDGSDIFRFLHSRSLLFSRQQSRFTLLVKRFAV
ncbi:MAG TPA: hypothetical protein VGP26_13385 [Actinophytocola sp.]|jgi:hypothetical protein|nr:hypothetical protein [Actinophytocola sp.]